MNITLDARMIKNSGIGVYVQKLIEILLIKGVDLDLLHLNDDAKYFSKYDGSAGGYKLRPFNASIYSLKELALLPSKTFRSKIFWSPHFNVPFFSLAGLKIVTIHDVFHLANINMFSAKQRLYVKNVVDRAVETSDLIFTVSEFSKTEILKYTKCSPSKIKVVYNGVEAKKFQHIYSEDQKNIVLKKCGLEPPYFLYVGNVKPHKNLKTALLGFREFIADTGSEFANHRFVIVGKKDGFITGDKDIKDLMEASFFKKYIRFTGWVDDGDLPIIYQNAFLFVFPSLYEGFGFPPLESMAANCPVVASNFACMKEIYGDSVDYFNPNNASSIAESIYRVAKNPDRQMELKLKGLKQVMRYNWDTSIEQKVQAIKEVL